MPVDTSANSAPGRGRKALRLFGRFLKVTLIGIVVVTGLLVAFPPNGLIKWQLERSASAATGRTVTIGGAHVTLWPDLTLALNDVAVANPPEMAGAELMRAKTVTAKAKLEPIFKGQGGIDSLVVSEPRFNLQEDATGGRNWVLTPKTPAAGSGLMLPRSATIEKGSLTFASAKSGMKGAASDIGAAVTGDTTSGAVTAKGRLVAGGEGVNFDVAIANANAVVGGTSSPLKASFDARPAKVKLDGTALFAAAAEFSGDVAASSASLADLMRWFGAEGTSSGQPIKTSLSGKVKATTNDVTFTDTDIDINGSTSRLGGRLDLAGPRPKLEGTLDSELLDLARMSGTPKRMGLVPESLGAADDQLEVAQGWDRLLTDLNALERGPATLEAAPELEAAKPGKGWSEEPFNLKAIGMVDLALIVTAKEIVYGSLDLKNGRIKADITDGQLVADIQGLDIAQGTATGTLNLDSRATPPAATVAIKLTDVAAEPIITQLTGKPLLSGISNVEINAKAAGQNQSQLTSTLAGKARFQMAKGAVRGFDIRRMVSEWWRSFKFDLAQKTNFEKLEARYDIKNGIAKSEPELTIGGSEVEISSTGRVNVPARRLNQDIRIKVVPPPTALPIPVRISGDWAKPDIGVDWNGVFSGLFGLGSPQAVAQPSEPPPAKVQAAIRRVLESNLPPDKLSDGAKDMLRSLLPVEQ